MFKNKKTPVFDPLTRRELGASKHIQIAGHWDNETLIDKSGKFIKIMELAGLDFVTQSDAMLDVYKHRRHHVLKDFTSDFALYAWVVRRKVDEYPDGEFAESNRMPVKFREDYITLFSSGITTTHRSGKQFDMGFFFLSGAPREIDSRHPWRSLLRGVASQRQNRQSCRFVELLYGSSHLSTSINKKGLSR